MKGYKSLFFIVLVIASGQFAAAQARYWVGVPGSNWLNGANWSLVSGGAGGAGAPTSVQDAIFDNGFSGTVSYDAGTITVNSLTIKSSATVTLSLAGATGRILTCNNGGAASNAFYVETGSTLTMTTATSSINFFLAFASSSKGQVDGTYITAGAIAGGSGGLIDATGGILTINGTYRSNSGSSNFTGATALNTSFNAGSVYEINKNGGSVPAATWSPTSQVLILGSNPVNPVFLGTSYGNLEVNAPLLGFPMYFNANISFNDVNLVNTGSDVVRAKTGTAATTYTLTINGNLTVSSSSILETSGNTTTSGNPGIIVVKGNLINDGIIRENGTVSGNQFILQGTSNQNVSGTGSYAGNDFDFIINNNSGATLLSSVTLPYRYTITSGNSILGNNNLTVPTINQAGPPTAISNHIVTNGTGKLVITSVGAFPAFALYPIGASTTTFNPMALADGGGLSYGARVEVGINPAIRFPVAAVNRTWFITPSGGTPGTVRTNFFYYAGDGNAAFNYTANLELGLYTVLWNVVQTGIVPAGAYQAATLVGSYGNNIESPLVLGNIPAILEAGSRVELAAQKLNDKVFLNWSSYNGLNADRFIPEHSADGRSYMSLAELSAADFSFTHRQPLPGLNYYRIKVLEKDGKVSYSNMVAILNAAKGFELINTSPNPVTAGSFKLNISTAQKSDAEIVITDMQGRVLQKQTVNTTAGFNQIPVQVNNFSPGIYFIYLVIEGERSKLLRFVVQ